MAIFDAMLEFSDEQDIGAETATGSVAATNVLDLVVSDVNLGAGEPVWLNVRMGTESLSQTDSDATLTLALVRETDTTIDGSSTVIYQTPAIAQTALTAGSWVMRMPLPNDVDDDRYIGLLYTIGGTSKATAGTINAWLDHGAASDYNTQVAESNI
jgi:hypothetical protein